MNHGRLWNLFRALLFLSGLVLVGYVAYRFSLFNPPSHGSLYGRIFPLALPFAGLAMVLAARPLFFARLRGPAALAVRAVTTGFAGVWMATGAMCTASTMKSIANAPLGGTIDVLHVFSDHVWLPLAVTALVWVPVRVAARLGAREGEPAALGAPAPSAGY